MDGRTGRQKTLCNVCNFASNNETVNVYSTDIIIENLGAKKMKIYFIFNSNNY